jgi:hypothetical protein
MAHQRNNRDTYRWQGQRSVISRVGITARIGSSMSDIAVVPGLLKQCREVSRQPERGGKGMDSAPLFIKKKRICISPFLDFCTNSVSVRFLTVIVRWQRLKNPKKKRLIEG